MMKEYRLKIGNGPTHYDPKLDPRISNEFATVKKTFNFSFNSSDDQGCFPLWPLPSTAWVPTVCQRHDSTFSKGNATRQRCKKLQMLQIYVCYICAFGADFLWQNMPLCYLNRFLQLCHQTPSTTTDSGSFQSNILSLTSSTLAKEESLGWTKLKDW